MFAVPLTCKAVPLPDTNNEPVIIADPLNGNPAPLPPPAFNENEDVSA
jgi:hypothetical protein